MINVKEANELIREDYEPILTLGELVTEFEKAAIPATGIQKIRDLRTEEQIDKVFSLMLAWENTQLRGGKAPMFTPERNAKGVFVNLKIAEINAQLIVKASGLEEAAKFIPSDLASESHARLLEKYKMDTLARLVRHTIKSPA